MSFVCLVWFVYLVYFVETASVPSFRPRKPNKRHKPDKPFHPLGNKYTAIEVTTMFPNAIGNMTFQPNFMSWS